MKINQFPELSDPTGNTLILVWDSETNTTKYVKASTMKDYFASGFSQTPVNIVGFATATASSSFNTSFAPSFAIDGITSTEWASLGQPNPWLQIDFSSPKTISKARIADRANSTDNANNVTLTFSDNSSSINVTGIPTNGSFRAIEFSPRTVNWVRLQVYGGTGANVGFSEIEIWGF